jgi:hypothetical protein
MIVSPARQDAKAEKAGHSGFALLLLSELELHEVTHESLLAATGDRSIRGLELCMDARIRDRIAGS